MLERPEGAEIVRVKGKRGGKRQYYRIPWQVGSICLSASLSDWLERTL